MPRCGRSERLASGLSSLVAAALLWPVAAAANDDLCRRIVLRDAAVASGLVFLHERGATGDKQLPETMGSGVAWLDYDGDGWLDLYVVQSGAFPPDGGPAAANRLFRNRGPGRPFAAVDAGAAERGYGQGVTAADVDGDGWTDLYVTNYGPDVLLVNRRDGTFAPAAWQGLDGWSSSAAFGDGDGDGDLDLYVTRYVEYDADHDLFCGDIAEGIRKYCGPELFKGEGDRFYWNVSADGHIAFEDATAAAGFGVADGKGLGVVFTDLDGDRRPDLYVANDQTFNFFFSNQGGGADGTVSFEDLALLAGLAVNRQGQPEAGMGIAVGDVDGDLDPDLMVSHFDTETNTLYLNLGSQQFEDASLESGFGLPSFNLLGFGLVAVDFDLDGDLDVYVANGHVRELPRRDNVTWAQPDLVLSGDGKGGFAATDCAPKHEPRVGRGLAWADWDRDGDPDLALSNSGGPLELITNGGAGRWLALQLRGQSPNTSAVGAEAVLTTSRGRQARRVLAGDSYQSSSSPELTFGLGDGEPQALEVTWPSGRRTRIVSPPAGRYLRLTEPLP